MLRCLYGKVFPLQQGLKSLGIKITRYKLLTFSFAVCANTNIARFTLTLVTSTRVQTKLTAGTNSLTLIYVLALPGFFGKLKTGPASTHDSSLYSGTFLLASTILEITRFVICALGQKIILRLGTF